MCRLPTIFTPASGWAAPYSARTAISPGISCSASMISFRPQSARDRSATLNSSGRTAEGLTVGLAAGVIVAAGISITPKAGTGREAERIIRSSG